MELVLVALLVLSTARGSPMSPSGVSPAPRQLTRAVLEAHGEDLKLLKVLGVSRRVFDWGTHFSINFTARHPPCPKPPHGHHPQHLGCPKRPGKTQSCSAQVSVFSFLPEVPLSMVQCGEHPPRSPGTPAATPGHPVSPSRPPPRRGTARGPLSPNQKQ